MVSTKHCCWGTCNSDSRFPDKLHKSLREMLELGMKIFIPFPKPSQGSERCQRWVNACSREDFTINNITRNTYICALHWPGQRGPTDEFHDPLKANFTAQEVLKASRPKRKAPQPRVLVNKSAKEDVPTPAFLPPPPRICQKQKGVIWRPRMCVPRMNYLVGVKTKTTRELKLNSPNTNCRARSKLSLLRTS